MDEAKLEMLMQTHGLGFPPVARALAELPDGHPLKTLADELQAPLSVPSVPEGPTTEDRLADIEARLAALEA